MLWYNDPQVLKSVLFSDTTDDEEEDDKCLKIKRIPPTLGVDQAELEAKLKEFMDKTKEDDIYVARLYVCMENYDVDTAITSYNTVLPEGEELFQDVMFYKVTLQF